MIRNLLKKDSSSLSDAFGISEEREQELLDLVEKKIDTTLNNPPLGGVFNKGDLIIEVLDFAENSLEEAYLIMATSLIFYEVENRLKEDDNLY
jgi:hypothetical protein